MRKLTTVSIVALAATLIAAACRQPATVASNAPPSVATNPPIAAAAGAPLQLLFLGDSYTKGEGIPRADSFPEQLHAQLQAAGTATAITTIAETGWRTDNLQAAIAAATLPSAVDLVVLAIGVNNEFQGRNANEFQLDLNALLDTSLRLVANRRDRVIMLSIPDWTVTPVGQQVTAHEPQHAAELDAFNLTIKALAKHRGIRLIDITPLSRLAQQDPALLATDGLHPSARQYTQWNSLLVPAVHAALAHNIGR